MNFIDKLTSAQQRNRTRLSLSLDIQVANSPLPIQYYDEPMLPFARAIIEATSDLVCAYCIRPGYFLAEGAAGMIALERIVRVVPQDLPIIYDARFAVSPAIPFELRGAFEQYLADAVTLAKHPEAARLAREQEALHRTVLPPLEADSGSTDVQHAGWTVSARLGRPDGGLEALPALLVAFDEPASRPAALPINAGCTMTLVVGRPIVYASQLMSFAEDARAEAIRYRAALG